MIPAYLHVENPADVGQVNTPFEAAAADLAERTGIPEAEWRDTWNAVGQPAQTWEVINTQEAASLLQEHGYDGIVAREGDTRTYAVFDPGQVKSAVANRGHLTGKIRTSDFLWTRKRTRSIMPLKRARV